MDRDQCHRQNSFRRRTAEFLASTHVLVSTTASLIDQTLNTNDLKVFAESGADWKIDHMIKIKVLVKNTVKAGNTVLVFSPSGWSQELTTTADGTVSFKPLWQNAPSLK